MPQYTTTQELSNRATPTDNTRVSQEVATRATRAMGGFGRTASAVSSDQLQFNIQQQEEQNTIDALNLKNQLSEEAMQKEAELQEQYRGSTANQYGPEFEKWFDKRQKELNGNLKNDHAKRMYGVRSNETKHQFQSRSISFMDGEHKKAQAAAADSSHSNSVANINSGMPFDDAWARYESEIDGIYRNSPGLDLTSAKAKAKAQLANEYFTSLLVKNPWQAMREVNAWGKDENKVKILNPAVLYEFREKARGMADKKQAEALYQQSLSQFGANPESYEDRVNWIRSQPNMSKDAVRMALSDIGDEFNNTHYMENQIAAEKRENALEEIYTKWNENDFQSAKKLIGMYGESGDLSQREVAQLNASFSSAGPQEDRVKAEEIIDKIYNGEIQSKADIKLMAPVLGKIGTERCLDVFGKYNKEQGQLLNSIKKSYGEYFDDWDASDTYWWDMRQMILDDWDKNGGSLAEKKQRAIDIYKKEEDSRGGMSGWWNNRWGKMAPTFEENAFRQNMENPVPEEKLIPDKSDGLEAPPPQAAEIIKRDYFARKNVEPTDDIIKRLWASPKIRELVLKRVGTGTLGVTTEDVEDTE